MATPFNLWGKSQLCDKMAFLLTNCPKFDMGMAGVNGQTDTSGVNERVNMLQGRMKGLNWLWGKRLQWLIWLAHKTLL